MKPTELEQEQELMTVESEGCRDRAPQGPSRFVLSYSGVDQGRIVMGDGQLLSLSEEGLGIRGNRSLKAGMNLALLIELPDSAKHMCIPDAHVSWVRGRRFRVKLQTLKREDQRRLHGILCDYRQTRPV